jgi:hypothetical protein
MDHCKKILTKTECDHAVALNMMGTVLQRISTANKILPLNAMSFVVTMENLVTWHQIAYPKPKQAKHKMAFCIRHFMHHSHTAFLCL